MWLYACGASAPFDLLRRSPEKKRAGDETRTRDIFLGKEVLYQLSYTRGKRRKYGKARATCQSRAAFPRRVKI